MFALPRPELLAGPCHECAIAAGCPLKDTVFRCSSILARHGDDRLYLYSDRAAEIITNLRYHGHLPPVLTPSPSVSFDGHYLEQVYPSSGVDPSLPLELGLPLKRFTENGSSFRRASLGIAGWRASGVATIVLGGAADDDLLRQLQLNSADYVAGVVEAGIDIAMAPGISVYLDQEPFERRLSLARSFELYEDLSMTGLPTVPHIGFTTVEEAEQLAELFQASDCASAWVDLQSCPDPFWAGATELLRRFCRSSEIRALIVNGVTVPPRMLSLGDALADTPTELIITNASPYHLSEHRRELVTASGDSLSQERRFSDLPKDLLRRRLSTRFRTWADEAASGRGTRH